jgi:cyclophilin family peptidyl-prolyl cis-trans isomerase
VVPPGDPTGTGKGGKSIYATPNGMPLLHPAHTLHRAALHICLPTGDPTGTGKGGKSI